MGIEYGFRVAELLKRCFLWNKVRFLLDLQIQGLFELFLSAFYYLIISFRTEGDEEDERQITARFAVRSGSALDGNPICDS
jgi:hypothetical protein